MEKSEVSSVEGIPGLETWKRIEGAPKVVVVDIRACAEGRSTASRAFPAGHEIVPIMRFMFSGVRTSQDLFEDVRAVRIFREDSREFF